jgi:hypothetical protein
MANILVNDKVKLSGTFNIASAATTYEFIADEVADVYRVAFIPTTTVTGAPTMTIAYRPTVGSATDEVVKETWTVGTPAAGKFAWHNIIAPVAQSTGTDGSLIDVAPDGPIRVAPGQSVFFDVGTAASAGTGYLAVYYWAQGLAEAEALEGVIKS